ncbi:hypothetical protein PENTCL1PPCAC_6081, partial [Pristionchus entomophagus]
FVKMAIVNQSVTRMEKVVLVAFALLVSFIVAAEAEDDRDRLIGTEKERVWHMLRDCCQKSIVCSDYSEIGNYFKCKEELGKCMDIRMEDLTSDAVDECDLINAEKRR